MNHYWKIHTEDQVAELILQGVVLAEHIAQLVGELTELDDWQSHFNILYHYQDDASLSEVTLEKMEAMLPEIIKRGSKLRSSRNGNLPRSAILYKNQILQSVMELWMITNSKNPFVEFKLYTSRDEAMDWLKSG